MNLTLVAKENVHLVWMGMKEAIEENIEQYGRELCMGDIKDCLERGEMQLWLCAINTEIFGWAITSIVNYTEIKRLRFLLLGGNNMSLWLKHIDGIEQWAAKMGIRETEAWVRPGLRKKLEPLGYEKAYEMVTKSIEKRVAG